MKRTMLVMLAVGCLVVAAWTAWSFAQQDVISEMDAIYAQRYGSGQHARQVLSMAEAAFAKQPDFEIAWRAARACFWICDRTEDEKIDKEFGKKGWDWADKALALNPDRVEGYYFKTITIGEYSLGISIATALFKGLGSKYEENGNKAIALNADFERAGPLRAMGRYYQKLPKMMRKLDKAEEFYKRAEQSAPCMTRTRFYMVEAYIEQERFADARATAQKALDTPGCPEHAWECDYYKGEVKKLLATMPTP